ncbi:MAG: DUF4157 domain-containing protein [Caulobacteraceae bacterium]|nr:DUF4157 domain-containing protein [Caulobacteraceae bacterium]
MGGRIGQQGLGIAVAAILLLGAATPTRASFDEDLRYSYDQGRVIAERAAREAVERSEYELRHRELPAEVAPAFAATIRMSRNRAFATGVRPVPAAVARALQPYFPAAVLSQARWRPPMPQPSMTGLLVRWYFHEGAVTLDDVVLFSDDRLAQDPAFWAHELTHVEQYRRYGVDGFARRYVANWDTLEREARQRADRVRAALRRGG